MKPFDLEQARLGTPLITRVGLPARLLCADLHSYRPLVVAIQYDPDSDDEAIEQYYANGCKHADNVDHDDPFDEYPSDLFLADWQDLQKLANNKKGE